MKKRYEVSATFAWKVFFQLDAESKADARIKALPRIERLSTAFGPMTRAQIIQFPTMRDYEVREVPLDPEERRRREQVDRLISQCPGPVFEQGGRMYKWITKGCTCVDVETGQRYVNFDGGSGTEEEYESWRQSEIAQRDQYIRELADRRTTQE